MDGLFEGITIDPVGAADLDDAVKIDRDARGWTVQIAFPRLTDAVRVGSHADGTARHRLETRYRPGGVAKHMLPDEVMKAARSVRPPAPLIRWRMAERSIRKAMVSSRAEAARAVR